MCEICACIRAWPAAAAGQQGRVMAMPPACSRSRNRMHFCRKRRRTLQSPLAPPPPPIPKHTPERSGALGRPYHGTGPAVPGHTPERSAQVPRMMLATTSKDRAVRVVDGFTGRPLRKYMLPAAAQVRPSGVMAFGVGWPQVPQRQTSVRALMCVRACVRVSCPRAKHALGVCGGVEVDVSRVRCWRRQKDDSGGKAKLWVSAAWSPFKNDELVPTHRTDPIPYSRLPHPPGAFGSVPLHCQRTRTKPSQPLRLLLCTSPRVMCPHFAPRPRLTLESADGVGRAGEGWGGVGWDRAFVLVQVTSSHHGDLLVWNTAAANGTYHCRNSHGMRAAHRPIALPEPLHAPSHARGSPALHCKRICTAASQHCRS